MNTVHDIVKVKLDDETSIGIVVERGPGLSEVAALPVDFETITRSVTSVARALSSALKAATPHKATVEVGFTFSTQEGKLLAVLAKGTAGACLKVTLEWSNKDEVH